MRSHSSSHRSHRSSHRSHSSISHRSHSSISHRNHSGMSHRSHSSITGRNGLARSRGMGLGRSHSSIGYRSIGHRSMGHGSRMSHNILGIRKSSIRKPSIRKSSIIHKSMFRKHGISNSHAFNVGMATGININGSAKGAAGAALHRSIRSSRIRNSHRYNGTKSTFKKVLNNIRNKRNNSKRHYKSAKVDFNNLKAAREQYRVYCDSIEQEKYAPLFGVFGIVAFFMFFFIIVMFMIMVFSITTFGMF